MKKHLPFAECIVWLDAEAALLFRSRCPPGTEVDEPDSSESGVSLMLPSCLHRFRQILLQSSDADRKPDNRFKTRWVFALEKGPSAVSKSVVCRFEPPPASCLWVSLFG